MSQYLTTATWQLACCLIDRRWWTGTGLSADPADATTVTVTATGPRVTIDAQMDAAATITGTTDDSNVPVAVVGIP